MVRAPCRPKGSSSEPRLGFLTSFCLFPSPVWVLLLLPASRAELGLPQVGTIDGKPLSVWLPPSGCAAEAAFDFAFEKMSSMDSDRPLVASFRSYRHTKTLQTHIPFPMLADLRWFCNLGCRSLSLSLRSALVQPAPGLSKSSKSRCSIGAEHKLTARATEQRWLGSFECKGGWRRTRLIIFALRDNPWMPAGGQPQFTSEMPLGARCQGTASVFSFFWPLLTWRGGQLGMATGHVAP